VNATIKLTHYQGRVMGQFPKRLAWLIPRDCRPLRKFAPASGSPEALIELDDLAALQ
jgi:hypothetical protein